MNDNIYLLNDGSVLVDKGPISMVISVFNGPDPDTALAELGAEKALKLLEEVSRFKETVYKTMDNIERRDYPSVVSRMISAVKRVGDPTMTPMAAVAGAIADEVADFLFQHEKVSKVIVNNGGDVAIRLRGNDLIKVGIRSEVSSKKISHIILVKSGSNIGGIATSGFGGRSFTKGIASAATAIASDASLADASATLLGNSTNVDDPSIERKLAESIYPDTDIPGHWVTTKVGFLDPGKVKKALAEGMKKAQELENMKIIMGALIFVKGEFMVSEGIRPILRKI